MLRQKKLVPPADRRYAVLQRRSASDTNFRCGNDLPRPTLIFAAAKENGFACVIRGCSDSGFHGVNLGIAARISPFTPSRVHRFLISSPDLGIDASFSRFKPSCVHRFLISSPDLRIDAKKSSRTAQRLHRFLISGSHLGIDAAPSLLHKRMARLQHSRGGAGRDRMPRRRHNPK